MKHSERLKALLSPMIESVGVILVEYQYAASRGLSLKSRNRHREDYAIHTTSIAMAILSHSSLNRQWCASNTPNSTSVNAESRNRPCP